MKKTKSIGIWIDALYKADAVVAKARKVLEDAAAKRAEVEEDVLMALKEAGLDSAGGKLGGVVRKPSILPQVKDWEAVHKYILKTKSFDLLEKRIARQAWRDRLEDNKTVPGIVVFRRDTIKLVKLKPKVSVARRAKR